MDADVLVIGAGAAGLFFAGEAVTPGGHTGAVTGAIASGRLAAARIFRSTGYGTK